MSGASPSRRDPAAGGSAKLGRVFGAGENPVLWSLPCVAFRGLSIRLHMVFVVFLTVRMIQSIQHEQAGLPFQVGGLLGLLVLVLAHESAHVFAARQSGLRHDRMILWPLGGLVHGESPGSPRRLAGVALAGPMLNLVLVVPLAGLTLLVTDSWEFVFFNPFAFRSTAGIASSEGLAAWFIWSLHANNATLLLFNLLVPMHPLDAGRLLQASLTPRYGDADAARISGTVGIASAGVMAAVGLVANEAVLLGVAVVGGFVSWQEVARTRLLHSDRSSPGQELSDAKDSEVLLPAETVPDPEEIDRILAKIADDGIDSLTSDERATLEMASRAGNDTRVP
ncbi:MAG: site-2 protease family protein [Planctomycetota bacterium]